MAVWSRNGTIDRSVGSAPVRVEHAGPVTTVILDRPQARNAVDGPTARALVEAFRAFDADPTSSVAVLWGEGGTFCAGADLKALGTENSNHAAEDGDGPMGPTRLRLSKPVIAAVAGYAVAGGLELALWCDLRIAEQDATFGVFCRRWGVPLIDGGTVRLPRIVGEGRATGHDPHRPPGRARPKHCRSGLVTRVVPTGDARRVAEELAAQLAALPQTCLRTDRAALYDQYGHTEEEALRVEFRHGLTALTGGALDGAARFAAGEGRHGSADRR